MTHPIRDKPDETELWFVDLQDSAAALDAIERQTPRLASDDLRKISNSTTAAAAAERRAAYIALRVLIERNWGPSWRGIAYTLEGSGKPALKGLPGSFSLTHVEHYALIALTHAGSIGVDLETDRRPTIADARRARIESAAIVLARGAPLPEPAQRRFLQAWVRLEAIAKADGKGIGRLLTRLGLVGADPVSGPLFNSDDANEIAAQFWVHDVAVGGGCVAAVARDQPLNPLSARTLPTTAQGLEDLTTNCSPAD